MPNVFEFDRKESVVRITLLALVVSAWIGPVSRGESSAAESRKKAGTGQIDGRHHTGGKLSSRSASGELRSRPNVIVLLADDLGWNGVQPFGTDLHETPHIRTLAEEGMRFTDAYAACAVCSPTRAALMTGKYPARLHVTDWIEGFDWANTPLRDPDWTQYLPLGETTIAEALRQAGYRTAHLGKWHLGDEPYYPKEQGFDVNVGGGHWGSPPGGYFLPNGLDLPTAQEGEYLTDHLTDRAVDLIEEWGQDERPFFLYFAYYAVHTPIQGKPALVKHYRKKIQRLESKGKELIHDNPTYAAMVHALDQSVGRIIGKLQEIGIARRTLIVFASDNGGLSTKFGKPTGITVNDPLRRGKGAGYEGGIRIPMIVRWPDVTPTGSVCATPVSTVDVYPTILSATRVNGERSHNRQVDGRSLMPLLKDPASDRLAGRPVYWHFPHYHPGDLYEGPYGAVRMGQWKLLEFYEDRGLELYNLARDIGEKNNLLKERRDKAEELRERLHDWRRNVDAQMPTLNYQYNPLRDYRGRPKQE